jgi:hypothetical protein
MRIAQFFRQAPRQARFPIAILSFDRPNYLQQLLASLRPQVNRRDEIILFQDGAWNAYSRRQKAKSRAIDACIRTFRYFIPWGTIVASEHNLGIAENYERAEQHLFGKLKAAEGLFLEDDLVLSPNFLAVTQMLLDLAHRDPRIGYVSAYGNLWASKVEQLARRRELIHMHENWGFALTRAAWLAERPFRQEYLRLVQGRDYGERDHESILRFYRERGWHTGFTSQDAARWIGSLELGRVRITTFACHARYIGRRGVHWTEETYKRAELGSTRFYKGTPELPDPPTDAQIAEWLAIERSRFTVAPQPFYDGHATATWPGTS